MHLRGTALRLVVLVVVAGAVVAVALPHHPVYREWRLSRAALPALEQEGGANSDDAILLYYHGLRLVQQNRNEEALPLLIRAVRLQPDQARNRDALAQAQMALGKTTEAYNQLRQYVGTHPNDAQGHLMLGRFYISLRADKAALHELAQATELDKNNGECWAALAGARAEFTTDQQSALSAAQQALRLRPTNPDDNLRAATILNKINPRESRPFFEKAVKLAPARADIHSQYAAFLLEQGGDADCDEAIVEAKAALEHEPENVQAQRVLGTALARLEAYADAVAPLTQVASRTPTEPAPAMGLYQAYTKLGNTAQAAHWLQEWKWRTALRDEEAKLRAKVHIERPIRADQKAYAVWLAHHGFVQDSQRYFALSLGVHTDTPAALRATAQALSDGGYAALARPLAQRAVDLDPQNGAGQQLLAAINRRLGTGGSP